MKILIHSFFLSIALFYGRISYCQVLINEVCSANDSVIATIDNNFSDWIELYNSGSTAVNIGGYSITRSEDYDATWIFPDYVILPNDYLTIFCPESDLKSVIDHVAIPISPGAIWRFQTDTAIFNPNWKDPAFFDGSWPQAPMGIGVPNDWYDSSLTTTIIDTTLTGKVRAIFLRKNIFITDTSHISFGLLFNTFDDGMVAYANGVEINRYNILAATPTDTSYAIFDIEPAIQVASFIDQSLLVNGWNTIAIEVHNFNNITGMPDDIVAYPYMLMAIKDTSILFPSPPYPAPFYLCDKGLHTNFNLSSKGQVLTLKDASGTIVNQLTVSNMQVNHSIGRYPDGSADIHIFNTPTPCASNSFALPYNSYTTTPIITPQGGAFSGSEVVTITAPNDPGANIRWTTDGSEPIPTSSAYSGPLTIDSTVVIRARNFSGSINTLPGYISTATFVKDSITLPIVAITSNPINLWDWNTGIYMLGPNGAPSIPHVGANFEQDWQRPAHVTYFDKKGHIGFDVDCKIAIHGNFSRNWPQKSFRILTNDDYGVPWIKYKGLFPHKTVAKFKSFNVRNSGIDWNTTQFRDGFINLSTKKLFLDYMDFQPCVLLINGMYFGVYGLREREDENFVAANNNLLPEQVDLLRFEGDVMNGTGDAFFNMVAFIDSSDLSDENTYQYVADSLIDIQNICDYFITETFYANTDWISANGSNNIKFWRPNNPPGKWRYIVWDTDLGTGLLDSMQYTYNHLAQIAGYTNSNHIKILLGLMENYGFKNYFINRYADLVNTTFNPVSTLALVDDITNEMAPEMARHFAMWGMPPINVFGMEIGRAHDVPSWLYEVGWLKTFLTLRPAYAMNYIETDFAMNKQVDITLETNPPNAGIIKINSIVPDSLPWTGVYFDGNPVTLTAYPNEGYSFNNWTSNFILTAPNDSNSIRINVDANDVFTANFSSIQWNLSAAPNPTNDNITIHLSVPVDNTQTILRIYSVDGRRVADVMPPGNFLNSGDYNFSINLKEYNLPAGIYLLTCITDTHTQTIKLILLNEQNP